MPTLSVLTPSFNYAWCIEDCLNSVALASENVPRGWNVEHVVVDDGSTDGSHELLQRWASRVTLELQHENHGQSHTLNTCLSRATGEWIGWLNADDIFLPWSLHDACQAFEDQVDVVYGDQLFMDRSARFLRLVPEHPFSAWTLRWWDSYLGVGSVFLRASLLRQLGWREDLQLLLDWDLWLRATESGARFAYTPTPYAAIRRHDAAESSQERPGRPAEKARVRREHRLPSRPWLWRSLRGMASIDHGLRKTVSGAYARQLRTRQLRNRSMRWFDDPEGRSALSELYDVGYARKWVPPLSL